MGGRITLDFRINGYYMDQEFAVSPEEELETDCYYVRAKLKDGLYAWSSSI